MRHLVLTKEESERLLYIHKHGESMLERTRSLCLLLSSQKRSMSEVSRLMNIDRMTIVRLLDAWDKATPENRFDVLYRQPGQGAKMKLEPVKDKIPELLENNNRNTKLMLEELDTIYGIRVCKETLQNFLKDIGIHL